MLAQNSPSPRSRIETIFLGHARAFALAGLLLSLLDTALCGWRDRSSVPLLPGYWMTTWAMVLWIGLGLTCAMSAWDLLSTSFTQGLSPRIAKGVRTSTLAIGSALIAIVIVKPWDLAITWPYPVLVSASLVAAFLMVALRSLLPRASHITALTILGVSAFCLDAFFYRRLYLPIHNLLFFSAFVFLAVAAHSLPPLSRRLHITVLFAGLSCQLALFTPSPRVRALGVFHGTVNPKVTAFIHLTADLDEDGYSPVFGGGDCNDRDTSVHPGACEQPASDHNCNGHVGLWTVDHGPSEPRAPSRRSDPLPDIYLFMVDTLRADFGRVARLRIAPEVERFASSALDFERAYTPYPSTYRAMLSMVQSRTWRSVKPGTASALELLARAGYDVRLGIGEQRLRVQATSEYLRFGTEKGDPFSRNPLDDKAPWTEQLVEEAIFEMADEKRPPGFRWIHVLDPHIPHLRGGSSALERYRREIRHVSRVFGQLVDALDATERGRRSIVIFMSDHGEEYEDHGARYHGATLYEENVHVPLIVRLPGAKARKVSGVVSLLDVMPTLFDAIGLPIPPDFQGRSLLHAPPEQAYVFCQIEPVKNLGGQGRPEMMALIGDRYKLIHNLSQNVVELYDLMRDPSERDNLSTRQPGRTEELLKHLALLQDGPVCQSF